MFFHTDEKIIWHPFQRGYSKSLLACLFWPDINVVQPLWVKENLPLLYLLIYKLQKKP